MISIYHDSYTWRQSVTMSWAISPTVLSATTNWYELSPRFLSTTCKGLSYMISSGMRNSASKITLCLAFLSHRLKSICKKRLWWSKMMAKGKNFFRFIRRWCDFLLVFIVLFLMISNFWLIDSLMRHFYVHYDKGKKIIYWIYLDQK